MANQWFKFYGAEYLLDPKMLVLDAWKRSAWVTLLCYASLTDGVVDGMTEEMLLVQAGVNLGAKEVMGTCGALKSFEDMNMITRDGTKIVIVNWKKRQESNFSNAEKQARYRVKHAGSNRKVTISSNARYPRIEENRIEENRQDTAKLFESFWQAYPKKKAKGQAEKTWAKLRPGKALVEKIIAAIEAQKNGSDWKKDGGRFIPHPSSWLNSKGWEDEVEMKGSAQSGVLKLK